MKSINIEDRYLDENISMVQNSVMTDSSLQLDVTGHWFDAVRIDISKTNDVRFGTYDFEINITHPEVYFVYDINETAPVRITLKPALGFTFDADQYMAGMEAFSGPDYQYSMGFMDTFEHSPPIEFEYPAPEIGDHYLVVYASDNYDYEFSIGESLKFVVEVQQFPRGAPPSGSGRQFKLSQSFAYYKINDIFNAFDKMDPNGTFNPSVTNWGMSDSDPGYAKAVGSAVFGQVRAADLLANVYNPFDFPVLFEETLKNYTKIAYDLYSIAHTQMYNGTANLYQRFAIDNTYHLEDNVYMLMATVELAFLIDAYYPILSVSLIDSSTLWVRAEDIANAIYGTFNQGPGRYEEVYDGISTNGIVKSESIALLADIFRWQSNNTYNLHNFELESVAIISYIDTNLKITSVSGYSISSAGIIAEQYDTGTSLISNTSSLLSNAFYIMHLVTQMDLVSASGIAENVLNVFSSSMGDLYLSDILVNGTLFEKKINTLDNAFFIHTLRRLEINFNNNLSPYYDPDISRVWGIKALNMLDSLITQFDDDRTNLFFTQYSDTSKKFNAGSGNVDLNAFAVNSFVMAILERTFPIQVGIVSEPKVEIDETTAIDLELIQMQSQKTWIWYDPFQTFTVTAIVEIAKFDYLSKQTIDLGDFFLDFDNFDPNNVEGGFLTFFYEPGVKGEYTVDIKLLRENSVLFHEELTLKALGDATALETTSGLSFATDDDEFTGTITLVDEKGIAIPNLQGTVSLAQSIENADSKYKSNFRTDSSGKASIKFDVDDIEADGIVNRTELKKNGNLPRWIEVPLFINITNVDTFNLIPGIKVLPVRIDLANVFPRVSPTTLQITQGSTEGYTFTVTALNHEQEPIDNARVYYKLNGIVRGNNSVYTDADGEATITLSAAMIVQMAPPGVNISMTIVHKDYPTRTITRFIEVLENKIRIIANPVQAEVQAKPVFVNDISPIDIEVATEDLFGKTVNAFVSIHWVDETWSQYLELETADHIAPYTFELDYASLPSGKYEVAIHARKDGLTSSVVIIETDQLSTSQNGEVTYEGFRLEHHPEIIYRSITVNENSIEDEVGAVFAIYGGWIAIKALGFIKDKAANKLKKEVKEEVKEIVDDIKDKIDDMPPEGPAKDTDNN